MLSFYLKQKKPDEFVSKELEELNLEEQYLFAPVTPASGGLALLWKKDVSLSILSANQNFIDTLISFKGKEFHGTFVYGEPDISKRLAVWTAISDLATNRDSPWFLTGDFNEITDNSEKSGGGGGGEI